MHRHGGLVLVSDLDAGRLGKVMENLSTISAGLFHGFAAVLILH
jgi:hypothetical protein